MKRYLLLAALIFTVSFALFFVASCGPATGESSAAQKGRSVAQTLVTALETYHAENGKYPQHLDELAPKYIPVNPQRTDTGEIGYIYLPEHDGSSYSLRYSYPRYFWTDDCIYDLKQNTWACGGAS
jgi:predicted lipoprotein with Yx(FWY)xxD motif